MPGTAVGRPSRRSAARVAAAVAAVGLAAALGRAWLRAPREAAPVSADVVAFMSAPDDRPFARVTGPRPVAFPEDEGAHDEYRTEWWYYTGNLSDDGGRRFGFQLTFFRSALAPAAETATRTSAWSTPQMYLAHFAVTDVEADRFHSAERLSRGSLGLAGAEARPYRVWLETWQAASELGDGGHAGPVRLAAADGPVAIDLTVRPVKPAALHGDRGYSRKGPGPGNASTYYSWTRLEATGRVTTARGTFDVEGLAWMDHEWSTSALDPATQVGWDWLSLHLDDGRDLMLFRIRTRDGGASPESSGSLVDRDGRVTPLAREDFDLLPRGTWTSPRTGGAYPASWRVTVPPAGLVLDVEPLVADQELETFFRYWEGASRVAGTAEGRPVAGHGYVEMTGYASTGGACREPGCRAATGPQPTRLPVGGG